MDKQRNKRVRRKKERKKEWIVDNKDCLFNDRRELGESMLYFLIDVLLLSTLFIYSGEQSNKMINSIACFLDETNQALLLKQCYYDLSFRQETLNQLEKLKKRLTFQLKEEMKKQFEQGRLFEDSDYFRLYSYQIEQLDVLQLNIKRSVYSEVLRKLPKEERHLDDWDLF